MCQSLSGMTWRNLIYVHVKPDSEHALKPRRKKHSRLIDSGPKQTALKGGKLEESTWLTEGICDAFVAELWHNERI